MRAGCCGGRCKVPSHAVVRPASQRAWCLKSAAVAVTRGVRRADWRAAAGKGRADGTHARTKRGKHVLEYASANMRCSGKPRAIRDALNGCRV